MQPGPGSIKTIRLFYEMGPISNWRERLGKKKTNEKKNKVRKWQKTTC